MYYFMAAYDDLHAQAASQLSSTIVSCPWLTRIPDSTKPSIVSKTKHCGQAPGARSQLDACRAAILTAAAGHAAPS